MDAGRWSHWMLWAGTAALVLGAVDPLEGSLVVVAGAGAVMIAAHLGHLRARHRLDFDASHCSPSSSRISSALSALGRERHVGTLAAASLEQMRGTRNQAAVPC